MKRILLSYAFEKDAALIPVYGDRLSCLNPACRVSDADDRWQSVFSSDDGGVGQLASRFSDDPSYAGEDRSPAHIGERDDQDVLFRQVRRRVGRIEEIDGIICTGYTPTVAAAAADPDPAR